MRRRPTLVLMLAAVLAAACATRSSGRATTARASEASGPDAAERQVPSLRLGDEVQPTAYAVELTLKPEDSVFSGKVRVDVLLKKPRRILWLNATELSIDGASLRAADGSRQDAKVVAGNDHFVGFEVEKTLPPGTVQLELTYRGKVSNRESAGLFHQQENGAWYDFTSFEPQDARRAIPCFDQPNFKTPWELTLHVPEHLVAVGNAPVRSETPEPGGMKAVRFQPTRPISSYLFAFGVGPFDVVDAGPAGRNQVPVRIVMAKGHLGQETFAAQAAPKLLSILEDYFDVAYPYEKMDLLAIPVTFGFGAMENPGLVTFVQPALLMRPEDVTVHRQRGIADTIAHEFAHQWFGNLVTTAWWDDIWLNEAFASWMTHKARAVYRPDWPTELMRVEERGAAMEADSLVSARQVRQPILTESDTVNAFDGITYSKGSAVISMFERWVGPEDFRRGVQRFLREHAFAAATSQEFLSAISTEAHRDVATPFNTFLDQPGLPLVQATPQCDGGTPSLSLKQGRYLPLGSSEPGPSHWQIPVCAQFSSGTSKVACTLLKEDTGTLVLQGTAGCKGWSWADAHATGYYVVAAPAGSLQNTLREAGPALTGAERAGLLWNAGLLLLSGQLRSEEALALAAEAAKDRDPDVVRAAAELATLKAGFIPANLEAPFARYLRTAFGARARALGFDARPGDDEETRLLRPALLQLLGTLGGDEAIAREARKRAELYLKEHRVTDPNMVDPVLRIAAFHGDRKLLDSMKQAAAAAPDRATLEHIAEGLAGFRQPELVTEELGLILDPHWDPKELLHALYGSRLTASSADVRYQFIKSHYDELVKVLPRDAVGRLTAVARSFCDEPHLQDVTGFFKDRAARAPGGARLYAHAVEHIRLCMAERETISKGVRAYVARH